MKREFTEIVEQGEKYLVGTVLGIHGVHSQGETLDELMANMREVTEHCLEEDSDVEESMELVGVHRIAV